MLCGINAAAPNVSNLVQFETSKEGVQEEYEKLKKEHSTIETELKNLRETYNNRQDTWIKEKLNMQVRLVDCEG